MKSKRTAIALVALATIALATPALADEATVYMNPSNAFTDIPFTITEESVFDALADAQTPLVIWESAWIDPFLFVIKDGLFIDWDDNSAHDPILNYGGARITKTYQPGDYVLRATYSLADVNLPTEPDGQYRVIWSITPTAVVIVTPPAPAADGPTTPAVKTAAVQTPVVTPKPKLKKARILTPPVVTPAPTPTVVAEPEKSAAPKVEDTTVVLEPTTTSNSAAEKLAALFLAGLLAWYVRRLIVGKKKRKKRN